VVFVLLNLVTYLFYLYRTYPNTRVAGVSIGSLPVHEAEQRLPNTLSLTEQVRLAYQGKIITVSSANLGITSDFAATAQRITDGRSWLPVANFLKRHDVSMRLHVDRPVLQNELNSISKQYQRDAVAAAIVVRNGVFSISSEVSGRVLPVDAAEQSVVAGLGMGKSDIELPVQTILPAATGGSLQAELRALQAQQHTTITLHFEGKSKQFTTAEIAGWFVPEKQSLMLSDVKIQTAIAATGATFTIGVKNLPQAVVAVKDALQSHKKLDFTLISSPLVLRRYTYCTATKGVSESFIPGLVDKLASVYSDDRGWSLGGKIV